MRLLFNSGVGLGDECIRKPCQCVRRDRQEIFLFWQLQFLSFRIFPANVASSVMYGFLENGTTYRALQSCFVVTLQQLHTVLPGVDVAAQLSYGTTGFCVISTREIVRDDAVLLQLLGFPCFVWLQCNDWSFVLNTGHCFYDTKVLLSCITCTISLSGICCVWHQGRKSYLKLQKALFGCSVQEEAVDPIF